MIGLKEIKFIGNNQITYNGNTITLDPLDYKELKDYVSLILSIITIRGKR